jgi:hypothetical protein
VTACPSYGSVTACPSYGSVVHHEFDMQLCISHSTYRNEELPSSHFTKEGNANIATKFEYIYNQ